MLTEKSPEKKDELVADKNEAITTPALTEETSNKEKAFKEGLANNSDTETISPKK